MELSKDIRIDEYDHPERGLKFLTEEISLHL